MDMCDSKRFRTQTATRSHPAHGRAIKLAEELIKTLRELSDSHDFDNCPLYGSECGCSVCYSVSGWIWAVNSIMSEMEGDHLPPPKADEADEPAIVACQSWRN